VRDEELPGLVYEHVVKLDLQGSTIRQSQIAADVCEQGRIVDRQTR